MKRRVYILLLTVIFLFGCTNGGVIDNNPFSNTITEWHLLEVLDDSETTLGLFEIGDIIWTFEPSDEGPGDGKIVVRNNNERTNIEDALDSGTYDYLVVEAPDGDQLYFFEDSDFVEFGDINQINSNQIIIDQRIFIDDENPEPYIYVFQAVVVPTSGT
ncbi:MAG: hypothetical protein ACON5F_04340 [Jejuia sp.]